MPVYLTEGKSLRAEGGGGGEEKWNYNTKYTYNKTNKTIIVKVTWHRTRTGMHTQRKQSWEYGCQSRADPDNRHLEKDLTSPQTPQPQALSIFLLFLCQPVTLL